MDKIIPLFAKPIILIQTPYAVLRLIQRHIAFLTQHLWIKLAVDELKIRTHLIPVLFSRLNKKDISRRKRYFDSSVLVETGPFRYQRKFMKVMTVRLYRNLMRPHSHSYPGFILLRKIQKFTIMADSPSIIFVYNPHFHL